jgi:kynurenine formamidase
MDGGKRTLTIDEIDLERCFQPGVKLDFRHLSDGAVAIANDVGIELWRIGHIRSNLSKLHWSIREQVGERDWTIMSVRCGLGREAMLFLLECGIRLTGTDGWSWDAPFVRTREKYPSQHDASLIWEGHNLEALPPDGFTVSCFPVKIHRASAGWTRAVAFMDSVDSRDGIDLLRQTQENT